MEEMTVHPHDVPFLEHCRVFVSGETSTFPNIASAGFNGLTGRGQAYLATMLSKVAVRFCLEKGGMVPGAILSNGKRNDGFSLTASNPAPRFSRGIYALLFADFRGRGESPEIVAFTPAANVVLLSVMERRLAENPGNYRAHFLRPIASHAPLPFICYFELLQPRRQLSNPCVQRFFEDPSGPTTFYNVRMFIRDRFTVQIRHIVIDGDLEALYHAVEIVAPSLTMLFDTALAQGHPEILEPFCEALGMVFGDCSHAKHLEAKLDSNSSVRHASDRRRVLDRLRPFYDWARRLIDLRTRALRARAYDQDYQALSVIKRAWQRVPHGARRNAEETLRYVAGGL